MISDRINTGAKVFLKSLSTAEEGREWRLIHSVVAYTGWLILFFVGGVCLISPEVRAKGSWILGWLSFCLAYLVALEVISRTKVEFYETSLFRMVRIQIVGFLGSALLWITGGAESYFWFIYLWSLIASALYFPWGVTWAIFGEVTVLYFLASLAAAGDIALIKLASLFTSLAFLLVFTVVFRYLVENVRKYQVTERKLRYSEILKQIQQDIDSAVGVQEVLDKILQRAVNLVGARDGSLMLIEEDGKLHFRARVGGLFPGDKTERTFTPGAPDEGIAGWVVRNCKPYVCRDTKTDAQFVDIVAGTPIRSLVSVPIISHGVVLGVINVDSPEPNRFSAADVELLLALADQVAVAIERAELLESLKQIGDKTLGGAEDLYQYIVDAVHRLTRCPVSMWRVDETGHQVRIVASRNISAKYAQEARLDLDDSVTGKAIRERRIIQVLDIQADSDFKNKEEAAKEGWQSMLVVPLLAGPERAVGTLSIYSMIKREEFTPWELDLLRAFASQAGVAIQNADLIQELVVLNEIGRAVSVLDVEAIAHLVYDKASQLMDTTNFFLCLYDKEREEFNFKIWMCNGQPLEPFASELSGLTSWVVQEKKPLLIADWDEEESRFPVKAGIVTERQRSWLGVPLLVGEEVIGVISVQSPEPYSFNLDTQRLLETIASQAAIAIQNARLFEQLDRRVEELEVLTEIGRTVSNLGVDQILDLVYEQTGKIMDLSKAQVQIAFYDEAKDEVMFPLAIEQDNGKIIDVVRWSRRESQYRRPSEGEIVEQFKPRARREPPGLTEYVIRNKQPVLFAKDFEQQAKDRGIGFWPTFGRLDRPTHSWLGVPMIVQDRVIGIISIQSLEVEHAFDQGHVELLTTVASQAAVAIENARLYYHLEERVSERTRQLEQAQARIAETEFVLARASIAVDFVHRLNNLAGTIPIWVDQIRNRLNEKGLIDDKELKKFLDSIEANTDRLLRAAEQLKAPPQEKDVDIESALSSLVRQVRIQMPPEVQVALSCEERLPTVRAVASELNNALWNIIENGIDAMSGAGMLTVSAMRTADADGKELVEIWIRDEGEGIPKDEVSEVFEPFYSTKTGHSGYGLWRAKNVIERIGGTIDFESEEGRGTTFFIRLPASGVKDG